MSPSARPATPSAGDVTRSVIETVLTVAFRRQWVILTLFVTVFGGVALATSRLPPTYRSEMKILVKNERADLVVTPVADSNGDIIRGQVDETVINSEIELLTSTDLLKKVVLERKLYVQPARLPADAPPDPVAVQQGITWLKMDLSIIPVRKSNIIQVSYGARSPEAAAKVLDTLASAYLEAHLQLHRTPGAAEFFRIQKARYQENLQQAEEKLLTFQDQKKIYLMAQQKERALESLNTSQVQLREAQAALAEATARVNVLQAQHAKSEPVIVSASRTFPLQGTIERLTTMLPELENRRSQLTMKLLPDDRLVREVEEEIANTRAELERQRNSHLVDQTTSVNPVWQAYEEELSRARATQAGLQARNDVLATATRTHQETLGQLQAVTNEFEDLQRLVKESEESYLLYSSKEEEARIADLLDQQKISNVALAESPTESPIPAGPNVPLNLALGLVLAVLVGFGAAIALEVVTATTVHTPAEIELGTGVPVLGVIPWGRRKQSSVPSMAHV
jgi:uncharacterized protein involved in exopolysaccharide biosynthesis